MNKEEFLKVLEDRFNKNMHRHNGVLFDDVKKRIENSDKLNVLIEMELSGGEVDLVLFDDKTKEMHFYDCSKETPKERRNVCYDLEALNSRKNFKPENDAMTLVKKMGSEMLNEEEYNYLQSLEPFDLKTSSWILTPSDVRKLGGAIFGDRRYDRVFIYHNGAESYYGVRGFRTKIII